MRIPCAPHARARQATPGQFAALKRDLEPVIERRAYGERLWINPDGLAHWQALNPVERYFALLEAWLFEADSEVLGALDRPGLSKFLDNVQFLTRWKTSRWNSLQEFCDVYTFGERSIRTKAGFRRPQ